MTSARSVFIRVMAAGTGLVFLGALLFVGLGWVVSRTEPWLFDLLGPERFYRLHEKYNKVSAVVWPGDRDGDGVRDVAEMFNQTDPANPADHPQISFRLDRSEFSLIDPGFNAGSRGPVSPDYGVVLRPGARIRVRVRLYAWEEVLRPGNGLQLRLTPSGTTQVGLAGAALSGKPVTVPVDDRGEFPFDAHFPLEAIGTGGQEVVSLQNVATGESLDSIPVYRVWPQPAHALTAEKVAIKELTFEEWRAVEGTGELMRLRFPSSSQSWAAQSILVEAAHDRDDAEWVPIQIYGATATSCVLKRVEAGGLWTGPLKFRAVPIQYDPP